MTLSTLFTWPVMLPLLLLAPLVWLGFTLLDRRRRGRLLEVLGARGGALAAQQNQGRRRARCTLLSAGLLLALLATAQPLWGESRTRLEQRGVDVLICLDVSRSMLASDLPPSRLATAQREIRALAERARGDRLGLVVFAGEALLTVPLTQDTRTLVDLVERAEPLSVPRGGTDLGAALDTALDALRGETGEHETVFLLTDGEDNEQRGLRAAERCRDRGITVHCVGFGSLRGSKIAVDGPGGETFLRDRAGNDVITVMDPSSLRRIAEFTGGAFLDATAQESPLVTLYESQVLPMARKAFGEEQRDDRENRYQWPLVAAFALWILELCLTDRTR